MLRYTTYAIVALLVTGVIYILLGKKRYSTDQQDIADGEILFTKFCSSCHGLEEDGFGPPLGGITDLLPHDPLVKFIRSPTEVINSGDVRAVNLHMRYKQVMPSFDWMEEKMIDNILAYINHESEKFHLQAVAVLTDTAGSKLTGRLVEPVKQSDIKIELTDVVQIPKIKGASPDLGIVTLRPHPSGDGSFFVSDQNGIIYRVESGKAEVFLDVRDHIQNFQSGPGIATGIGSFDFHPDFKNSGLIYISHAETFKGQRPDYVISDSIKAEVQWVIGEWKMDDVSEKYFRGKHRELLRLHAPTFAHGCQDIGFVPGLDKSDPEYGMLYIGYGDGGSNNIKRPDLGHNVRSFLGTVMRIDPAGSNSKNGKYGIPPDNPFFNGTEPGIIKEIYAYGFRNPHRLAWDEKNRNRMMVTDIGEANIEEINIVEKGGDYGWPNREGDYGIATTRDLKKVYKLKKSDADRYKRPFVQYDHEDGYAIGGGYVYEGEIAPLKNKYVFGDIVNGKLFYVNIDPLLSDSAVYELKIIENDKETTLAKLSGTKRLHQRIGYDRFNKILYVITKADGKIRRISTAYQRSSSTPE